MEAFATVADLEARRGPLTAEQKSRAPAALEDVSAAMAALMGRSGVAVDPEDAVQAANLRTVCCSAAYRMLSAAGGVPYTQASRTAGPFSASVTLANPNGDLYLTKQERALIGLGRARAGFSSPAAGGRHVV